VPCLVHQFHQQYAGCTIHRNPYREMMAKEEKEDAEAATSRTVDALGVSHDSHKIGQWFSNPKDSVKQLAAPGGIVPTNVPVLDAGKTKKVAKGGSSSKVKAAVDTSEFDAW
jgi:hypothetical protein